MSPPEQRKSNTIKHIVRIRQMLKQWRKKATSSSSTKPIDVPAGHVAIYVGANCKRFVIKATHLNHAIFKKLLVDAEEEYGFTNPGPLMIPCDESYFAGVVEFVSRTELNRSCSHVEESRPLLYDSSIC